MEGECQEEMRKERNECIDILKGILILLVIIGHCYKTFPNGIIQIIYWFHMPCFFMISGYLFTMPKNLKIWLEKSVKRLIIPHVVWFSFITLITGNYKGNRVVHFILGARNIGGVYWYIPCFLVAMLIFILIEMVKNHTGGGKTDYFCIIILYLFSCIYILEPFKRNPENITFSFGTMSLACTYIGVGYYVKKYGLLRFRKSKIVIGFITIILSGMIFLYKSGIYKYRMDMNDLKLGLPIFNIIIPGGILVLLIDITHLLKGKVSYFFAELGRGSLMIMYIHKFFLNDILENIFGTEGLIWIINVIVTIILSYCTYKLINRNNVLKRVFGG